MVLQYTHPVSPLSVGNSLVILAEVSGGTIIPAVPGPDGFNESRYNIVNVNVATIHETLELGVVGVIPPCCLFLRSSYSWHIVDMRDEGKITLTGPASLTLLVSRLSGTTKTRLLTQLLFFKIEKRERECFLVFYRIECILVFYL